MSNSPAIILYDINGNPLVTTPAGALTVDGSGVVQPISGTVSISNFPVDNDGYSTVAISNFPASQIVTIPAGVAITNFPATQPVSGSVSISNFPATQPVSGTVAATQSGTWTVQPGNTANTVPWLVTGILTENKASTAAVTAVAGTTSSQVVLAANATRTSAHISNGTNKTIYIKLGSAATTALYTDYIFQGNSWDCPETYQGPINVIGAAGISGNMFVTECSV